MRNRPVALDLFSGAGGFTEGLLTAGINVAVSVEKDPHAAFTHAYNHPDTTIICDDIRNVCSSAVRREVKKRTGQKSVDIVVGGPPCQGFSAAGRKIADDDRNYLVDEFARVVSECLPTCFVFENVPDILHIAGGNFVYGMLDQFWSLGYTIIGIDNSSPYYPDDFPIVDSSWFGTPQRRKRLILVGWRNEGDNFHWLSAKNEVPPSRRLKQVSVYDAIGDLDFLKAGFECHSYRKKSSGAYQLKRRARSKGLFNHLASDHRPETVEMFKLFKPGGTVRSIPEESRSGKQRRARLAKSQLSHAVVGLQDDFIHYLRHRVPTVRELARLQSFDDDYVFFGKRTASGDSRKLVVPQYNQVGNAVPPLVAKSLGRAILASLGYHSIDLRNRKSRPLRQLQITGSSGFSGYGVTPELGKRISLVDSSGRPVETPVCTSRETTRRSSRPSVWCRPRKVA